MHIDIGQESVPLESQLIMLQLRTLLKSYNAHCFLRYDQYLLRVHKHGQ